MEKEAMERYKSSHRRLAKDSQVIVMEQAPVTTVVRAVAVEVQVAHQEVPGQGHRPELRKSMDHRRTLAIRLVFNQV